VAARLNIRDATTGDTSALEVLFRDAALSVELYRDALLGSPSSLEWAWPEERARVRVIERPGGLLAFSTTLLPEDEPAEIDDLFVAPDAQRGGIDRVLVEDAAQLAATAGHRELEVVAGNAEHFYRRCGFGGGVPVTTSYAPAVRLVRQLPR